VPDRIASIDKEHVFNINAIVFAKWYVARAMQCHVVGPIMCIGMCFLSNHIALGPIF